MASKNRIKGTVYIFLCVGAWALIPVVSKLGQTQLDNHQFLFWSSLVSFIVLFFSSLWKGNKSELMRLRGRDWLYLIFLGLLGTYIYYLFLYLGYAVGQGMEVLVIQYTWPILIVLLSLFIHRETLTIKKVVSLVLGFLGVLVVLTRGKIGIIRFDKISVILLVALGALCFALFSVLGGRVSLDPLAANTVYFLTAAVTSFFSMLIFSGWDTPQIDELLPVLLNGILVNGISYYFWIVALRETSPSYAAPFIYISPVLSSVYLVLFFKETFLPAYGAALALVLTGGFINSLRDK